MSCIIATTFFAICLAGLAAALPGPPRSSPLPSVSPSKISAGALLMRTSTPTRTVSSSFQTLRGPGTTETLATALPDAVVTDTVLVTITETQHPRACTATSIVTQPHVLPDPLPTTRSKGVTTLLQVLPPPPSPTWPGDSDLDDDSLLFFDFDDVRKVLKLAALLGEGFLQDRVDQISADMDKGEEERRPRWMEALGESAKYLMQGTEDVVGGALTGLPDVIFGKASGKEKVAL